MVASGLRLNADETPFDFPGRQVHFMGDLFDRFPLFSQIQLPLLGKRESMI